MESSGLVDAQKKARKGRFKCRDSPAQKQEWPPLLQVVEVDHWQLNLRNPAKSSDTDQGLAPKQPSVRMSHRKLKKKWIFLLSQGVGAFLSHIFKQTIHVCPCCTGLTAGITEQRAGTWPAHLCTSHKILFSSWIFISRKIYYSGSFVILFF